MERLTEYDEFGNADIIALSDMMPEIYAELSFSEANALTDALNRLAAYEDTGMEPEEIAALLDPQNNPLTLDELREKDGDWAWIEGTEHDGQWVKIVYIGGTYRMVRVRFFDGETADVEVLMRFHEAKFYRRKKEA